MPNIMLTYSCNLNCSYCFANEFVNTKNNFMTIENFQKALSFSKTSKGERIGLIGGEPTTHPNFDEILDILIADQEIQSVMIFTNGTKIDKYIDKLSHFKFKFLINCNSPSQMGAQYEKMVQNMELLYNRHKENFGKDGYTESVPFSMGINFYEENQDYNYFVELAKKFEMKIVRMSITVPNSKILRQQNSLSYFKKMKGLILSFIKDLSKIGTIPGYDCNDMPPCVFTIEELEEIRSIINGFEHAHETNLLSGHSSCSTVIDILPNLQAVRCFGLSDLDKVPISDFKSIKALRGYFFRTVDTYKFVASTTSDCNNCYFNKTSVCNGGCLAYKIEKIKKLQQFADKLNNEK